MLLICHSQKIFPIPKLSSKRLCPLLGRKLKMNNLPIRPLNICFLSPVLSASFFLLHSLQGLCFWGTVAPLQKWLTSVISSNPSSRGSRLPTSSHSCLSAKLILAPHCLSWNTAAPDPSFLRGFLTGVSWTNPEESAWQSFLWSRVPHCWTRPALS